MLNPLTRTPYRSGLILSLLITMTGCSSETPAAKQPAAPPDKIQGRGQVNLAENSPSDTALNAGGPSVYLISGLNRYRLFLKTPFQVNADQEYVAEGVLAQKAIDALGDPDQGKHGYPLESSCDQVVRTAWPGLALDLTDSYSKSLCAKVKRYPARPVLLVTKIEAAPADAKKKAADAGGKAGPTVEVAADKQAALKVEGATVLPAPLWEPNGGTARCKVVIDEEGKIAELNSGSQLCETVQWSQFSYKPTLKGGKPVEVSTEVEVRFEARK